MVTDLTMELFHIAGYLNKIALKSPNLNESYHRMLDLVQQFHEDSNSFEASFSQLEAGLMILKPILIMESNKEWSQFVRQFFSLASHYRQFCKGPSHAVAESIYLRNPDIVTSQPLDNMMPPGPLHKRPIVGRNRMIMSCRRFQ